MKIINVMIKVPEVYGFENLQNFEMFKSQQSLYELEISIYFHRDLWNLFV